MDRSRFVGLAVFERPDTVAKNEIVEAYMYC